jgi:hypothetical protein
MNQTNRNSGNEKLNLSTAINSVNRFNNILDLGEKRINEHRRRVNR